VRKRREIDPTLALLRQCVDDAPPVAVVTEEMVRRFWPGESALGKRFRVAAIDGPEVEVVGVARDYKVRTPGESAR
jgi:hypothetical protein